MGKIGRPKGSKNNTYKLVSEQGKVMSVRIDLDLVDFLVSKGNKNRYINNLIRKEMEEQINIKQEERL